MIHFFCIYKYLLFTYNRWYSSYIDFNRFQIRPFLQHAIVLMRFRKVTFHNSLVIAEEQLNFEFEVHSQNMSILQNVNTVLYWVLKRFYHQLLRAFQCNADCNATKLQICTKIDNVNLYMLLNLSEFIIINVYDVFFLIN